MASLAALLADLVGPAEAFGDPRRPDVAEAAARCLPGEVVAARDGDEPVAVVRLASGEVCVLADACPHDGGLLSDGFVEGDRLVCARHQWELDARTGRCAHRPGVVVPARRLVEKPLDS